MDVGKHQNCNTHGGPLDSLEEAQGVGGQSAASAYLDLSRSAPAAWAGGLGLDCRRTPLTKSGPFSWFEHP